MQGQDGQDNLKQIVFNNLQNYKSKAATATPHSADEMKIKRNTPGPLIKSLNFVIFFKMRNLINFVKC